MKIRTRLYLSAFISILLVVILGVITFVTAYTVDEKRQLHETAHHMLDGISELDNLTYEYLLHYDDTVEMEWTKVYHDTASTVGEELALSIRADYAVYGDLFMELLTSRKKVSRLIQEGSSTADIQEVVEREDEIIPELLARSHAIIINAREISDDSFTDLIEAQQSGRNLTLAVVIGCAALIAVMSVIVARSISGVLDRLNAFSRRIGEGEAVLHEEIEGQHERRRVGSDVKDVVDQLVRMQGELFQSERMATLGQFSGNISHELRNPLGVIDSSVYFLKMKLKDADAKTLEHLNRIKSAVDNSTAIIESLLNLTRMKSPDFSDVDLKTVVHDAIVTSKLPKTIETETNFPESDIPIQGDREQLRMALKNIFKNASEAMDGEGRLFVSIRRSNNGYAELSIKDTGPGIAADDMEKVFQPLFTRKAKGIGFGLSITQMVIEKHRGSIRAQSEPGEGAEFVVIFPVTENT